MKYDLYFIVAELGDNLGRWLRVAVTPAPPQVSPALGSATSSSVGRSSKTGWARSLKNKINSFILQVVSLDSLLGR